MPILAEMMQRKRQQHALTQEDAAAASGIPVTSWKRYESSRGMPSAYNARALAAWLGVTPEEVVAAISGGNGDGP